MPDNQSEALMTYRTHRSPLRISLALVVGFCLGLTGCARAPSGAPAAAPISVTVSYPVARYVTDYSDAELLRIGDSAQWRVLDEHTSDHRAQQFESAVAKPRPKVRQPSSPFVALGSAVAARWPDRRLR